MTSALPDRPNEAALLPLSGVAHRPSEFRDTDYKSTSVLGKLYLGKASDPQPGCSPLIEEKWELQCDFARRMRVDDGNMNWFSRDK